MDVDQLHDNSVPQPSFEGVKLAFHCHNKIACWRVSNIKMRSLQPGCAAKCEFLGSFEDISLRFSGLRFSHLCNLE